ncbi:MAG: sigma-70 family RNA polymerase sigma factor [Planctomycetota bacterium]
MGERSCRHGSTADGKECFWASHAGGRLQVEVIAAVDTTQPSLLLRIRNRSDAAAWETFDAIYRPMLHRFALSCGLRIEDADDVVQHCMRAVAEHIDRFEYDPSRGRFKSWLRTLVNNRVRSLATRRREARVDSAVMATAEGREVSPDDRFERIWDQEHLWHCLRQLRSEVEEKTFEAFRMYVIEDQPAEHVSTALGISTGALYTIKWRLTERLATHMRTLLGEDE